jgi:hypothetical protein
MGTDKSTQWRHRVAVLSSHEAPLYSPARSRSLWADMLINAPIPTEFIFKRNKLLPRREEFDLSHLTHSGPVTRH